MKYGELCFSDYTRVLYHKDEIVVGNIANDGRWVKLKADIYNMLCNRFSNCPEKEIEWSYVGLVEALTEIQVLRFKDMNEFSNKIKEVTMELTTQCNLHCKHCSYSFGSSSGYEEMGSDMIYGIAQWAVEKGIERITLTGGEIFCRKDIYEVISNIRRIFNGRLNIITNGTLVKHTEIDRLMRSVNQINISLDGYDDDSVQEIRGAKVFEKIMVLIHSLKEKEYDHVSISCIDTNDLDKNRKFKNLADHLGIQPIMRQLNLKGRARDNFEYRDIDYYLDENGSAKATTMKCVCDSNCHMIFISAKGLIHPCAALREDHYKIGQVNHSNGRTIISIDLSDNVPVVEKIPPCQECNVRYFCTSTCASQNDQIYLAEDLLLARCRKQKAILMKSVWGI